MRTSLRLATAVLVAVAMVPTAHVLAQSSARQVDGGSERSPARRVCQSDIDTGSLVKSRCQRDRRAPRDRGSENSKVAEGQRTTPERPSGD